MMPDDLMTCSKVDVTWSQSLTMSGLELMSGKLSLEHLTPGNWYCNIFDPLILDNFYLREHECGSFVL